MVGVALPFAGGTVAGIALGYEVKTAIFLGAALTATSVGITARVFGDLRALATSEARIVLGAAVADDVLGLVILTVVVKVVTGASVGFGIIAGTLGLAIGFLLATGVVGLLLVPRALDFIHRKATSGATIVVAALVVTLAFAELADAAKLAFIIGAFMAGLGLGRSDHHERITRDLGAIGNILIPVFFVLIGVNADLSAMGDPKVLGLAAVLTVVGIVGKIAASVGAFGVRADKLLIGLGMIPRGEVGLIFASIGLTSGVLGSDLYGALLVVVLVTTMITPPLLRARLGSSSINQYGDAPWEVTDEPDGGWLQVVNGSVLFRGTPPVTETVPLALHTALRLDRSHPSDELLDWFGRNRNAPLEFDPDDTPEFINVLRSGNSHTWRFLEVTGVLERALPEIAASLAKRRTDIRDLDPLGALRFPTLENLRELAPDGFVHDDELILAALSADVCEESPKGVQCAVDLATRLGRIAEADHIASIVSDAYLLRSGAGDPGVFDEHEILQLATHLASPVHARQAYTLARSIADLPRWREEALEQRYALVQDALDHPGLTGSGATNLAAARRQVAQRLAATPATVERLRQASTSYLLAHDPGELARQARLVEPLPRSGVVRVAVTPDPEPDRWKIDVACRDTPRLLTHLAKSLADAGLDVVGASIATWADGAVLDTFTVRATTMPSARVLALAMEDGLRRRLEPQQVRDVVLEFDNDSMPWYTVCIVSGPDQPGALYALSSAFSAADVAVHTSACVIVARPDQRSIPGLRSCRP